MANPIDPASRAPLCQPPLLSSGPPLPPSRPPPVCLDPHRDQSLADACRNAGRGPANDRVLYVGLNTDSASIESGALLARGVTLDRVIASASHQVTHRGRAYDVSSAEGIDGFTRSLATAHGLDDGQRCALAGLLTETTPDGRDELARIAMVWAPAEEGKAIPSRLILSGHSAGGQIWGDHALITYAAVRELGGVLPRAARQIEDVHLSGCFTEREVQAPHTWMATFPNLKTLWGYRNFSPSAPVGHLANWEIATRGRGAHLGERFVAAHGSATAWSHLGGIVNDGLSLDQRRNGVRGAETRFPNYLSGERRIAIAHQPDAEADYAAYQMLASHGSSTPEERREAALRAGQMLRLRFYEASVRSEFAARHGGAIDRAFARVGLPLVRFETLSRKDALAVSADFEQTAAGSPVHDAPEVARARTLLRGLAELRPDVLPESWCH